MKCIHLVFIAIGLLSAATKGLHINFGLDNATNENFIIEDFQVQDALIRDNSIMFTAQQWVLGAGYPFESYEVQTADGYLLGVFRIPGTPANPSPLGKPVVFLQHGLLLSSADWIVLGPGKALAYLLADAGYDVWLGNARGNTNSRKHSYIPPDSSAFWEFSWHQIGIFDLPAMIDFVLQTTGESQLHYAGHSQGTTSYFVLMSMRPEYNAKVKTMHALAPVAFLANSPALAVRALAPFANELDWAMSTLNAKEFLPNNEFMINAGYILCRDNSSFQEICSNVLFLVVGFDSKKMNISIIPAISRNTPAGASFHQITHYLQGAHVGGFRLYNYGHHGNMNRYGTPLPPEYPLARVSSRVVLHYGASDRMAAIPDVLMLAGRLPNLVEANLIPFPAFNHLDFLFANDARNMLYDKVISMMNEDNV